MPDHDSVEKNDDVRPADELPTTLATPEKWRYACPRDHVALEPYADGKGAYCPACGEGYDLDEIRDKLEGRTLA